MSFKSLARKLLAFTPYRPVRSAPNRIQAIDYSLQSLHHLGCEPTQIIDRGSHLGSDVIALKKPFQFRGGFSWSAEIPAFLRGNALKRQIPYRLFENDTAVKAPSDADHIDIQTLGEGRHTYWTDLFCFSAADNTDPNSNDRTYELRKVSKTTLGLWPLGGCTIYDPISLLSGNFAEGVGYRTDKEGENGF